MSKRKKEVPELKTTTRHYVRVVAFVVFGIAMGALLMVWAYPYIQNNRGNHQSDEGVASSTSVFALTRSAPTALRIPKINVNTTFETPLGLNEDKSVQVPKSFEKVGWYKYGPTPGEIGPAVILGHVDSYQGAAVFYLLGQLAAGDRVFVTRADGTEAEFEVMYFERYNQAEFPTEKVYGTVSYPALRLITCTGKYIKGEQRYTQNLVVYAKLVEPSATTIIEQQ